MSKNRVNDGDIIQWTNGTGSAVSAGEVVEMSTIIGVAETDIANGATGSVAITGVYSLAKTTDATAGLFDTVGAKVSWDTSNNRLTLSATGIQNAGVILATALAATTTATIKLNP